MDIEGFIGVNFQVTEQNLYDVLEVFGDKAFFVCGRADTVKYIEWSPEEHIENSFAVIKKYKAPAVVLVPSYFESQGLTILSKDKILELNRLALEKSKVFT